MGRARSTTRGERYHRPRSKLPPLVLRRRWRDEFQKPRENPCWKRPTAGNCGLWEIITANLRQQGSGNWRFKLTFPTLVSLTLAPPLALLSPLRKQETHWGRPGFWLRIEWVMVKTGYGGATLAPLIDTAFLFDFLHIC